ncbi:DNA methyltransferase 1-associated protein 1 [Armadillidium nasatum]|uniref:DNA methyltransferase 1-associated protein 1 n=1 Tax=Armadillidium nasatum TaxID=96803 RepID=A0A5N5STC3_9CRUS|nr:DNA methyltransferase 1-associated protein 1 [Armadillidium nasatum]
MADVRDILEIDYPRTPEVNKDAIMGIKKDQSILKRKRDKESMKRPEGMHRELYALLYSSDGPKDLSPLIPTDTDKSYKSVKAKLGMKKVRPWEWMPFTNPARTDDAVFYHWRRVCDKGKEYPFATFNKTKNMLNIFRKDTGQNLDTDSLFDLCQRFDLRWSVIHDRWPSHLSPKSMEELKARYYEITNQLKKCRNLTGPEGKIIHYDADHEKRRKEQLIKLYDRTPKQIEEEQQLQMELRKIEARKKEREKKTQDLQKLISAADSSVSEARKQKIPKKKIPPSKVPKIDTNQVPIIENSSGIKFPDIRSSGVNLRSQKLKLPANIGQKKAKAIEQIITELGLELNPIPVEEVCQRFNDLRSDLALLYDLRTVLLNYVFELQTLKHQYESLIPGKTLEIPDSLSVNTSEESPSKTRGISEVIDSVATPSTPNRKRRAALEQSNVLRKIKART